MDIIFAAQPIGKFEGEGLGPFGTIARDATVALTKITGIVSALVGLMTVAAGIWFLFQLLIGGVNWISSSGDKGKLETARNRITHALVGLIIVFASYSLLAIVGKVLGYDILLSAPGTIIQQIRFQ